MVNLKELEKRLDDALAAETAKSLSDWLLSQRGNNLYSFLGEGSIEKKDNKVFTFYQTINIPENTDNTINADIFLSDDLAVAA